MLFQVLGAFERLAAKLALVWLERNVNADMRGDMVTLNSRRAALAPGARKIQVVCGFSANMDIAEMVLEKLIVSLIDFVTRIKHT